MSSGLADQVNEIARKLIDATSGRRVRWQLTDTPGVYRLDQKSGTILISGPMHRLATTVATSLGGMHEIRILDANGDVVASADDSISLIPGGTEKPSTDLIRELYDVAHRQVTSAKPELDEIIRELGGSDDDPYPF